MISLALKNPAPVSASWADDITASMILLFVMIGPFSGGGVSFGDIGRDGRELK